MRGSAMKRLAALLLPLALLACAPAPKSVPSSESAGAPQAADTATFQTVSVQDLKQAVDAGAYVLDVRTPQEFAQGHIAGAVNLPLGEVAARAGEVPGERPVYVICRSGSRSAQASGILAARGKDVINVGGGMNEWTAAGYGTVR